MMEGCDWEKKGGRGKWENCIWEEEKIGEKILQKKLFFFNK